MHKRKQKSLQRLEWNFCKGKLTVSVTSASNALCVKRQQYALKKIKTGQRSSQSIPCKKNSVLLLVLLIREIKASADKTILRAKSCITDTVKIHVLAPLRTFWSENLNFINLDRELGKLMAKQKPQNVK